MVGAKIRERRRELSLTSPKLNPRARTRRVEIPGITENFSESFKLGGMPRFPSRLSPRRFPNLKLC